MTTQIVAGLILGAMALSGTAHAQTSNPHTEWGIKFFHNLEYKRALEAFKQAKAWKGNTQKDLARIYVYEGITLCELMRTKQGKQSFRHALDHDPAVQVPEATSPKIKALFNKVKAEKEAAEKPAPITPAPEPSPAPPPAAGATQPAASSPAPGAPSPKPPPPADATSTVAAPSPPPKHTIKQSSTSRTKINWPSWVSLGVGVVAGTTAIALGVASRDADEKSADKSLSWDEAMAQHDRASSLALSANVLYAVAGAALVTSGIFFFFNRSSTAEGTSASVVPTRSGIVVGVAGRVW